MILLILSVLLRNDVCSFHLNSIMILLIHTLRTFLLMLYLDLNSIMILLIRNGRDMGRRRRKAFKFHYDSINSIFTNCNNLPLVTFKFHYDSINSKERKKEYLGKTI